MRSIPLPRQVRLRQRLEGHALDDAAATLVQELARIGADDWRGCRVGVALGSRGIDQIAVLARTLVTWLRAHGAEPFVVPAMGSHGGATPDGQRELLASYGITSETLGVPVRAEMDTDHVGRTSGGVTVHLSRVARDADAVVLVTEWDEFRTLDWHEIAQSMSGTVLIDGRNALDPAAVRAAGLAYEGIGRS